jgi:formamidopyrimidine-DNA glycosylase
VPELPDITVYIEALEQRIQGTTVKRIRLSSPFLLRTAVPPISSVEGRKVTGLRRLGKRICIGVEDDLWLVLHLMIAGRLHWYTDPAKAAKARGLASFEFGSGTLTLTEAGTQKRASLHVV